MENQNNNIENDVLGFDALEEKDITLDPNQILYRQIFNIQNSINKSEDTQVNLQSFIMNVEMFEVLCKSKNMLGDDYETKVDDYLDSEEYKESKNQTFSLINKKFGLLCNAVFSSKEITTNLKG